MKRVKFGSKCSKLPASSVKTEKNNLSVKTSCSQRTTVFQGENHSSNMCKVLNDLRLQGICCDVNIRVPFNYTSSALRTEVAVYKAHSVVLTARSEFFKSYYTKLGNPHRLSFILPTFINPKAVEIILQYIYTGRLSIRTDTVSPIYQVGWLFQMDDVLLLCTQFCKLRNFKPSHVLVNNNSELNFVIDAENVVGNDELNADKVKITKENQIHVNDETFTNIDTNDERRIERSNEFSFISPEMSVTVRSLNRNELQLADGPPEMIECTPIIMENEDSIEDEHDDNDMVCASKCKNELASIEDVLSAQFAASNSSKEKFEVKLIIFKPLRGKEISNDKDDLLSSSTENFGADAESIVVTFSNNKQYPSPVLYILDGIHNYVDELIKCRFFHVEFHVKNACRKGVVKTDGKLLCVMFGQVNHFFPISHAITDEDIVRYRQEKREQKSVNIKVEGNSTHDWDPIFGNDREGENDVLYCFACSCVFFTIQGKASHLIRHHREILHWDQTINSYMYKCGLCDIKFQNLRRLYFHRHHEHSWKLPEVVLQFRCGLCFVSVCSIHKARDHLNNFHKISTFETKSCGAAFVKPENAEKMGANVEYDKSALLDVNKSNSPDGYIFKCGQCKKELHSRAMAEIHERKHRGEKPYQCSDCDYAAYYAGSLKTHVIKKHSSKTLNSNTDCSPQKKKRRRRKRKYYY